MLVSLKCLSDYKSTLGVYEAGKVYHEIPQEKASQLLADSPASFALLSEETGEPQEKALDTPIKDKAIKAAPKKK